MAEQITNEPVYYTKNFGDYSNSENNFVTNQELTVTITLNEYRELIKAVSTSADKIDKIRLEGWEKDEKIKALKAENASLKTKIFVLQNPADELEELEDDEN
ncbi:hypothetical protein [Enterococcus sp. JM9B]|uniref:hypothetical protein n=1 Tax=Enterococcus sp. JM9B TaxID=1857216 RepID=UPI001374A9AC|nr:hypothetical protein [Enterococcus sp. JM9B]KAF1303701.1 hypothetical protein BAU16_03810 [Enterococcus sp. JM9B]